MKRLTFSNKQSVEEKTAMVKKRGYDTGKPSAGASKDGDWKVKPTVKKKKIGLTATKKF